MGDQEKETDYDYMRYKYIIENIKDVIWEIDHNYVFTFVSPNVKEMTGYSAEEMVGHKFTEFIDEQAKNYIYEKAKQRLSNFNNADSLETLHEVQFVCKNRLQKWIQVAPRLIFVQGRFAGYIGATRDITDKKVHEAQLNKHISELQAMNIALETMATVDILTGAYNRRKFNDDLNMIIQQKKRNGMTFSLIFFDIDNFKNINDCYGHEKGDSVLHGISRLVTDNVRSTDGLFRWGGEEFLILLREANLASAKNVAEKIRRIIQAHDFEIPRNITISLGVGEYNPDENNDQFIKRIDKALLTAKARGKNQVICC
ncbi:MAG: diguanylate cyclase [Syntrophomonas sp.]|nr:diguanylate cyclase [Syntrophomonas sp.]